MLDIRRLSLCRWNVTGGRRPGLQEERPKARQHDDGEKGVKKGLEGPGESLQVVSHETTTLVADWKDKTYAYTVVPCR